MSGWRVAGGWFLQNWALFLCTATRRYQISSIILGICNDRESLSQIDPELVLPTMRSAIEEQLSLIAKGKVFIDGFCYWCNNSSHLEDTKAVM
jgi:hypothetical protein